MDVYLDAVLHPNCVRDPKTFAQEGWHYELEAPEVRLMWHHCSCFLSLLHSHALLMLCMLQDILHARCSCGAELPFTLQAIFCLAGSCIGLLPGALLWLLSPASFTCAGGQVVAGLPGLCMCMLCGISSAGRDAAVSIASHAQDDLAFKGVVFNEMKGVYSSPDSMNARATQHALFPANTYADDSGGDPAAIPDLTFEECAPSCNARHMP